MSYKLYADSLERRDKLQLYADIIKVSNRETKITRILRLANIQYNTFLESIEKLCKAGLLKKDNPFRRNQLPRDTRVKHIYKVTKMGLKWCEMVDEIYQTLEN